MSGTGLSGFDASRPYELHPQVALRPEPFGALAYHYGNRRLTFLKSKELVGLVETLSTYESAAGALSAFSPEGGPRKSLERALAALCSAEVIRAR